ncbi:helix-turn-helix transcriptional regulator [Metamycoplasma neophronis]|uniref:Helix-turn-helix domain-containing protein n=1 Tax=Metamycoplasma neophronis TaxID=872983 RepID=A0ABY2Z0G7_9BACT|nr:helix-turn-helix transcriptional regulator [Metamycoplasma neophronis]TPR53400.1 helix-turn-helix domain-containing protein [Metamycoplasma neophronis]
MKDLHLCETSKIKLHGKTFSEELQYYLKKFKMTQRELSLRINVSAKYLNQILNNQFQEISASIIEALEYAFDLEAGSLIQVYNMYVNGEEVNKTKDFKQLTEKFGIQFLMKHPELAMMAKIKVDNDMTDTCKLIMLKKFYGVKKLEDYATYLKEHVMAEYSNYINKPNSIVWMRYCELSLARCVEHEQEGVFRLTFFEMVMKKLLNVMARREQSFTKRIETIKKYLFKKGIILITKPYIHNSFIRAISLKKRGTRYIFLSDMYNNEAFIFFSLLHEVVHCFYPDNSEEQTDIMLEDAYNKWENMTQSNYKAIYDAIHAHEQAHLSHDKDPDADISHIVKLIQERYPYVEFEDRELSNCREDDSNDSEN